MTHQELLEKYAEARLSVIGEFYSYQDKFPILFQEIAIYANENGLMFPECVPRYNVDPEDQYIEVMW